MKRKGTQVYNLGLPELLSNSLPDFRRGQTRYVMLLDHSNFPTLVASPDSAIFQNLVIV